jgi:membrane protease YdiL (CAAX protease family)
MTTTPPEIVAAYMASLAFWVAAVLAILTAGKGWPPLADFQARMLAEWKRALAFGAVFLVATGLAGRGFQPLGAVVTFCQALIGLALARAIPGFEPLPMASAILHRDRPWRRLAVMLGAALLAVAASIVASMAGTAVARLFGEVKLPSQGEGMLVPALWQLFLIFLAGAGLAEETPYRLVVLSLAWRLSGNRWLAILVAAAVFGAYHLTPLSGMYLTFWQYPLTQFLSSTAIGVVWGYLYVRRGYETTVLAHTLSDWLPVAVFVLVMGGSA